MAAVSDLRLRGIFGTGFITFKWQDNDDTEDEIINTMRMAVTDLDEIKHILETKIREYKAETKSYGNMKTLCSNFNKITDTLITLWRGTHKLQELQTFPSLSFLEHVMRRCFRNAFVSSSYSEVFDKNMFDTTDDIFKHLKLNEDDVLIDINCGIGSLVLQMAASGSFKYCYGISLSDETAAVSETLLVEFTKWMGFYGKDYTEFRIFREDFMSSEMLKLVSESTILFLKDFDVEPAMKTQIVQLFSQLKEETRVVSLRNCEQFFGSDDKIIAVEEFGGKQSSTRFFVHTVKFKEKSAEQSNGPASVPSVTTGAPKRRNSAGQKKNNLQAKQAAKREIPDEIRVSSDSIQASLDKILNCYREQFIRFVEFMQSPDYRQQLEVAVKQELLKKTELEEKLQSLIYQISELNGNSVTLAKKSRNGVSDDVKCHSDLLDEVQGLLNQNKELRHRELKLNDEISHLERTEIVKQCHDQLSNLRSKEDDLSAMNRQFLLSKAGEWYQNYTYLSARVKSLEAEVSILEGSKQIASVADRQKSVEHFVKSFCEKNSDVGEEEKKHFNAASLFKQNVPFSSGLEIERNIKSLPKDIFDGVDTEKPVVDKSRLGGKFCGPAFATPCTSSAMIDLLVRRCASGDQVRCLSPYTMSDAGHLSSSAARAQKLRHRSSSSTDTADSAQDLKFSSDGDKNFQQVSGFPASAQNDVTRLPASFSRPDNPFYSMSCLKQPMPVSEALRVLASYSTCNSQNKSNAARNQPATNPGLNSSVGRGKPAPGKRGRKKRTPVTPSHSGTSVSNQSVDAGNLDALFLAVSLHHLSPHHRDLGRDSSIETKKSNVFDSCHLSSVPSLPHQFNNSTVAMATGQSSITMSSWSPLHGAEFRTPAAPFSSMSSASRHEQKLSPELGIDDSHGKHFKKKLHSSNFKLDQDKKSSSKVLSGITSAESATPILKYLFTKQESSLTSPSITKSGSSFRSDIPERHLTGSHTTTLSGSGVPQTPPEPQTDQITASSKSLRGTTLQDSTDLPRFLNTQWSDAMKLRVSSWYSLPMSSLLKSSLPQHSSHGDVFPTAHTLPGTVAKINLLSTSPSTTSKDGNQYFVGTTSSVQTTESRKTSETM